MAMFKSETPAPPAPYYFKIVPIASPNDNGRWVLAKEVPDRAPIFKLSPIPGFTVVAVSTRPNTPHTEELIYDPSWVQTKEII